MVLEMDEMGIGCFGIGSHECTESTLRYMIINQLISLDKSAKPKVKLKVSLR